MIANFEESTANLVELSPLSDLRGARVAVDAANYLERILTSKHGKEQLLPALGGVPFALKALVLSDLAEFASSGIEPFFVFSGLDIPGKQDSIFSSSERANAVNTTAWELYNTNQAEQAVETFGTSGITLVAGHVPIILTANRRGQARGALPLPADNSARRKNQLSSSSI